MRYTSSHERKGRRFGRAHLDWRGLKGAAFKGGEPRDLLRFRLYLRYAPVFAPCL